MQNSNSKSKLIITIVAVTVLLLTGIAAVAYALIRPTTETEPVASDKTPLTQAANPDYVAPDPLLPTIAFTDEGFSRRTYTFPAGTAIKVDNQSSKAMQFSSDDHPAHKTEPKLNMKTLEAGESGTFTPPGKGTYGFHDHLKDQYKGTLIIE